MDQSIEELKREVFLNPHDRNLKRKCLLALIQADRLDEITVGFNEPKNSEVYWKCSCGYYVSQGRCPVDGSRNRATIELAEAKNNLREAGQPLSMEALKLMGVSKRSFRNNGIIVIDYPAKLKPLQSFTPCEAIVGGFRPIDNWD